MLPPIDEAILQSNPKFAALHANLTSNILNPNGSTKNPPSQKERDANFPALKEARIRSAKSHLLLTALRNLELTSPSTTKPSKAQPKPPQQPLPSELVELILLLTSRLSATEISPSHIKLLESTPQWRSLHSHLPYLGTLLSTYFVTQASALTRILSPTTNASFVHRNIPKLCPSITALQQELVTKKESLHKRRNDLTTQTTLLLQCYQSAITLTIQLLETSKHGSLSLERHYQIKINYLTLEVEKVELAAREKAIKGEKLVYNPQVVDALVRYKENLRDARDRMTDRKKQAERVLWGYGIGRREDEGGREKEKVMKEIAKVYGELNKEVRDVGRDVDRLRGK
ncbi:hypothetical protein HYFRA_00010137 [Hymenoscyphus fraxineus]|uniref:Uncharacterized protein n=1 Tax=Hymenoscyphus fraxineus TaxID=746836 RepID=A0A9N9PHQ9_9HELO|nr:hypothetical protein HYFRA_00010137 [Hymenoscyphus fraxineus]